MKNGPLLTKIANNANNLKVNPQGEVMSSLEMSKTSRRNLERKC